MNESKTKSEPPHEFQYRRMVVLLNDWHWFQQSGADDQATLSLRAFPAQHCYAVPNLAVSTPLLGGNLTRTTSTRAFMVYLTRKGEALIVLVAPLFDGVCGIRALGCSTMNHRLHSSSV